MGCEGCSINTSKDGKPRGCKSNGGCSTGGCNKLNTFDWLTALEIEDVDGFDIVEVSFKQGTRKLFYRNQPFVGATTGDTVVVESKDGYDVGTISLSGEMVRMQMKKKNVREKSIIEKVLRCANERDLEKLREARNKDYRTMVRSRVLVAQLGLKMKVTDVEYQGDGKKVIFYYIADGRVDFRDLIKVLAKEFRIKVEMRQIGARQEAALVGGLGSCGRELCCSTWLTDFKTVNTSAARYQNLAINQAKLSGMCGRLKCCLNFELDTYMDALKDFPKKVDKLQTQNGTAVLIKSDIFKRIMYFAILKDGYRGKPMPLTVERVNEIREMNKNGKKPVNLADFALIMEEDKAEDTHDYESVNDVVELPPEEKRRRRRRGGKGRTTNVKSKSKSATAKSAAPSKDTKSEKSKDANTKSRSRRRGGRGRNANNKKTK